MFNWFSPKYLEIVEINDECLNRLQILANKFSSSFLYKLDNFLRSNCFLTTFYFKNIKDDERKYFLVSLTKLSDAFTEYPGDVKGILGVLDEKFKGSKDYKQYFVKINEGLIGFVEFIEIYFIPAMRNLESVSSTGKRRKIIFECIENLLNWLIFLERIFESVERNLDSFLENKKKLQQSKVKLRAEIEEYYSELSQNYSTKKRDLNWPPHLPHPYGTFERALYISRAELLRYMHNLKVSNNIKEKLIERFGKENLKILDGDDFISGLYNQQEENQQEEKLREYQRRYQFLKDFHDFYYADNQAGLDRIFRNFEYLGPNMTYIGLNSGLTAYCGVMPFQHLPRKEGRSEGWHGQNLRGVPPMEPKYFAGRLANIMTRWGYLPSVRELSLPIFDIKNLNNIFFYPIPHINYGGMHGLISFDANSYCVFSGMVAKFFGQEYFIITPKPIPINKLTLNIYNPVYIGDQGPKKYQQELIQELDKLSIPYKLWRN